MNHRMSLLGPDGMTHSVIAAGEGPTLMLLHGFPLDHRLWLKQIEYFADRFKVICPEFRGFGNSAIDEAFSLAQLADDIEFIRRSLSAEQPMILCGLSMGGYVAFEYWAKYSQHLRGLVLANTKPQSDTSEAKQLRLDMAQAVLVQGTSAATQGMEAKLLGPKPAVSTKSDVRAMIDSIAPKTIAAAQTAMAARQDFSSALSDIRTSTLVVTGSEDPIAPPNATRAWAAQIPGAEVQVIEDAGHLTPMESPDAFNQVLEQFLAKLGN